MKKEFTVAGAYTYDVRDPWRWIISHLRRHGRYFFGGLAGWIGAFGAYSMVQVIIGRAIAEVEGGLEVSVLAGLALVAMAMTVTDGLSSLLGGYSLEILGKRFGRDALEELYISLLGKSQVYHDRQRTGDLMARATEDIRGLIDFVVPGVMFIFDTCVGVIVPLTFLTVLEPRLMLVPLIFLVIYAITAYRYSGKLNPIVEKQREQFGIMNASLEETISGIEIVKGSAQEPFERVKFRRNARQYRDYFVAQGQLEARYLPMLLFGIAVGLVFLHSLILYRANLIEVSTIITAMGLFGTLRFPVYISIFSWSLIKNGYNSAKRILDVITAETELDENATGYAEAVRGDILFENVSFGYEDGTVLENLSFSIKAGQTVAIVGQTGSGKSTLTQLVNRTYDVTAGRILIDGVDVRDWSLDALRSQISKIEQDIFLFSRSITENIAFGAPDTPQDRIEQVAQDAQAHTFITGFNDGYKTKIGERGATLSGGQRQRIALARAFLSNPRILILDDSTSAIDSATEDEIQKALRRAQEGRTVLLITHRLSQIRWADHILVLDGGKLVSSGTHEELLQTSPLYQRIFARYESATPSEEEASPELQAAG